MTSIAQQLTSTQVRGMVAAEKDDLSDVTTHTVSEATNNTDLVNLSTAGYFVGGMVREDNTTASGEIDYTVDAGATQTFPTIYIEDPNGDAQPFALIPPVRFDSSLVVTLKPGAQVDDLISGVGYTL